MLKKTLLAGAAATVLIGLPVATMPAFAQNTPTATAPSSGSIKSDTLIGHSVVNNQNEKIGDISSVYVSKSGQIESVIVGVGGFLGIGEREVALKWSDLQVSDNGNKIVVNATKDQLKAMPEYKYTDRSYRGGVFGDTGLVNRPITTADRTTNDRATTPPSPGNPPPAPGTTAAPATPPGTTPPATMPRDRADGTRADTAPRADAARDTTPRRNPAINANGQMSASAIIGADVRNHNNETIGKVQDVFVSKDGAIKGVVVGVGGFLGVGEHNVMLSWDKVQLREDDDHDGVVINTDATKDSLKAMPEYKKQG
jgi:sporulation protein YlmC with PRC-barrel domain